MIKQYGHARKMTKGGNIEEAFDHANHPLDAAFLGGHALNESYKVPAANKQNSNPSYRHPLRDPSRENAPTASVMIASKVKGKNPGTKTGFGPIT